MATYDYFCHGCEHSQEESHLMRECATKVICCAKCGAVMSRIPQATRHIEGYYAIHDNPVWYSNLAQKMPGTKKDPKAWFTSRRKAEDYAKKMADTYGGSVVRA